MVTKNIILLAGKNWTTKNNVANHLVKKYSFSKMNYNNMDTLLYYTTKLKNDLVISDFSFNNKDLKLLCKKTNNNLGILLMDDEDFISENIPVTKLLETDNISEHTDISLRKLEKKMLQYEGKCRDKSEFLELLYSNLFVFSVITFGMYMGNVF